MAQEHNALKYFPALARLGERAFGIDDGEQSITRMSETLQGVADLYSQQEWAVYRKEVWFARRGGTSPAVAARNSAFELVNNTASSGAVIAVVRAIQLCVGPLTFFVEAALAAGNAAVANSVLDQASPLDSRLPIAQVAQCNLFRGDLAANLAQPQVALNGVAGTTPVMNFVQFIVVPGFKLQIVNFTQNQALTVGVVWTERPPFPGELSS